MNWLSSALGPAATAELTFDGANTRKHVEVKKGTKTERLPLFIGKETVSGTVTIKPNKKLDHNGIKVEFLGHIAMDYDHGNHYEFLSLVTELAPAGDLSVEKSFPFSFENVEKQYESYNGVNVSLRYFVRVTVAIKKSVTNLVKESDIWVHNYTAEPEINNSIKMEVGIEDCLHIEFEYNKSKYHLRDVIIGKIYFLLVRIKIKHMEIALIKRESTGSGPNLYNESETLTKFETMDGAPVRGESIPVRLFLAGFELTPTYRAVHNKYSVKYHINLVLVDEEDRRYFKQQEITLYRKRPKGRTPKAAITAAPAAAPATAASASAAGAEAAASAETPK